MKVKVSDFIADFLVENGVKYNFTVPGGGAMFLNNSLGHKNGLTSIYNHHEQACAIAAEAYQRINNELPVVCVTTGPGGTNAITGVLGAWLDSIPMLILSGQVRYEKTARYSALPIRAMGDQEYDITKSVEHMTKYSEMISNPKMIKYCLQKAIFVANNGRPGPCWLDIPLDVQSAVIDTKDLIEFNPSEYESELPKDVSNEIIKKIIEKVKNAKRPVLNAGNGIRISGGFKDFCKLIELLNIPVVTGWDSIDLIDDKNPLYVGRAGLMGDRPGNWAIQNSDLILSIGSRLGVRQVGYDVKKWAREAFVIMVDIDKYELKKDSIHVEMPVHADAKDLMRKMNKKLADNPIKKKTDWVSKCNSWKDEYPVVLPKHYESCSPANVYCFIKSLSSILPENKITVVGNGSACVVGSHAYEIKKGQRFIINSGAASMGYDLPAAIGACFANGKKEIICVTGDGSIQMNLQELQTIVHHNLPIKLFVINNGGYHSMRQTQKSFFPNDCLVGVGVDSGDISFPSMEKISNAYGIPYNYCECNEKIPETIDEAMNAKGPFISEIYVTTDQIFEPKSSSKRLVNGKFISPALEDLAPFLTRKELKKVMIVPMIEEE